MITKEHIFRTRSENRNLYDCRTEHDACGVGFLAHMKGEKSHAIIKQSLHILDCLEHRGAAGCDPLTGDGAGILCQIPDAFFRATLQDEAGLALPEAGHYGVAMLFLPQDDAEAEACRTTINTALADEGLDVLAWRNVPNSPDAIGPLAREVMPKVEQVFIGGRFDSPLAFDRKLYVARSVIEQKVKALALQDDHMFYVNSMSARTIVYKGLLLPFQVEAFYADLHDERFVSSLAIVHSRYSTNTLPTWDLSHPFRFIAHNGEINTLRGNINWMRARERNLKSELFSEEDLRKLPPVINEFGSDSACFDNAFELLALSGRSLPEAMMMMVPEAWENDEKMDAERKSFYRYHSHALEPWDGPAALAFTDGKTIGATLDRNGLRPARYVVTEDDLVVMASEVGVLEFPAEKIVHKGRLHPGRMFVIDTEEGRIIHDTEIKARIAGSQPYAEWLQQHEMRLEDLPAVSDGMHLHEPLVQQQRAFGYSLEDLRDIIAPMANDGKEPTGSMGNDAPLAILSNQSRNFYDYFKQLFAQVTNPPIDPIRERVVMTLKSIEGPMGNLLVDNPVRCERLLLDQPVLSNNEMERIATGLHRNLSGSRISTLYEPTGADALQKALEDLCNRAATAVRTGTTMLVLSDRGVSPGYTAIPALLATAAVHHHLIRENLRMRTGLFVESGDVREVAHFALLIGYGAGGINPYLVQESIADLHARKYINVESPAAGFAAYQKAVGAGLLKIFSKMGISTLQSYKGAQIFEAVGLASEVIDQYFTGTASRIEGADVAALGEEIRRRHTHAYVDLWQEGRLDVGGQNHYRLNSEHHQWNPETIALMQQAVREGDYNLYKQYAKACDDQSKKLATIRGLLAIKKGDAIPLEEVEPASEIVKRFATGAMSFGSISREAHETLAIAMNRLGGKSNTGEGGEDRGRWVTDANGDLRRSAIKQVASGRFGVTTEYLVNADELQIKMAQGAKPGEGGQLPGHKVNEEIAAVRHSTPGVGLISPPPHHDIYSIEDLAQLIFDLKNVNPDARISVKLVAEVGVGTVAAGVSKAHSDVVLISGHDGGTGASPLGSIKHAGLPWEIGLAETQQVLVQNDLRGRIIVQTDGQLKTGRDVVIAALLGAEEYGFATSALIAEGCIMMRKCHLNTCPVGVATQNPELRKRFSGKPEHVVNFFTYIAEEVRELMAEMGFRSLDELVGRVDLLDARTATDHWKANGIDLSKLLAAPVKPYPEAAIRKVVQQDHGLAEILDKTLIEKSSDALADRKPVSFDLPIRNVNRTAGTMLAGEVAKRYGAEGLDPGTIRVNFSGSAGQSFGTFMARGMEFVLDGDANDYVGKGMSGGRIVVRPPQGSRFVAQDNMIVGNTCLYGATGGEVYLRGRAGERFGVRNSGCEAVVEGLGDHGSEYMTGGVIICIGETGRNFAAGMSGGLAYIYDPNNRFADNCNSEMVTIYDMTEFPEDVAYVQGKLQEHQRLTGSKVAEQLLADWENASAKFRKVYPNDLRRVEEERAAANKEAVGG